MGSHFPESKEGDRECLMDEEVDILSDLEFEVVVGGIELVFAAGGLYTRGNSSERPLL